MDQLLAYPQRFLAAALAIAFRRFALKPFARAVPPILPSATAAGFFPSFLEDGTLSSISPVAILAIMTARAFTSAGRFSPLGPFGITDRLLLGGKHKGLCPLWE